MITLRGVLRGYTGARPALTLSLALASTVACGGSDLATAPPMTDPGSVYFSMRANHQAVTLGSMPPYDTLQLSAIPYAADGTILSTSATPKFFMGDSSAIRVTPDGVLHATATSGTAQVHVSLTIGDVTYQDSIPVTIYPSTTLPKILSAQIVRPLDSAKRAYAGTYVLNTIVKDSQNVTVPGIPVRIWVDDSAHFAFNPLRKRLEYNRLRFGAGTGMVHAGATIFGRVFRDSMAWTLGYPLRGSFSLTRRTVPGKPATLSWDGVPESPVYIGVGGVIAWNSGLTDSLLDIVFEDPSLAKRDPASPDGAEGNIAPFYGGIIGWGYISRSRKFTRPGTVRFRSARFPQVVGTIVVIDERSCLPDCPPFP